MAEFVLDLTKYKDRRGAHVAPGRYRVVVQDAEWQESKSTKRTKMINLFLRIQGGEFDGMTIIDRLFPENENSLWRIVTFMQTIGLPTPNKRLKLDTDMFVGRQLEIEVEDGEPYNGTVKSEVRGMMAVKQQSVEADDLDEEVSDGPTDEETEKAETAKQKSEAAPEDDGDDEPEEIDLESIDLG